MNCFTHSQKPAVGICVVCQKAVCHQCVGREAPRLVCRACTERGIVLGYEYKSKTMVGGWPLVHVCAGVDPVTMRPKIASGVIAIGNIALGGLAVGGLACGVLAVGGGSIGLAFALGGAALGLGLSVGGLAVGSIALGGAAVGFLYAMGGGAIGPAVIDGQHCDAAAREFIQRLFGAGALPPNCR
jgi:hypothetical protein